MLAVIAAANDHGIPRDRLVAIFWPESDEEHARQSARQALYSLRQELGREVVRSSGNLLSLDPAVITSDVGAFKAALAAGDRAGAIAIGGTAFLDGFTLPGASSFQRWADEERDRLAGMRSAALLALAAAATYAGRTDEGVEYWRLLTEADPLNGRYAVGYLKALGARGDRAAALSFARKHESVIRRELEVDPDPDVRRLEGELRAMVAPVVNGGPLLAAVPNGHGAHEVEPRAALPAPDAVPTSLQRAWRRAPISGVLAVAVFAASAFLLTRDRATARADEPPIFAVGLVQEVGIPDSARIGRVLTDMLATNLARIEGLHVLANSRLLQLVGAGGDSAAVYADAARRAGASDLLEGQLFARPEGLVLELRRVELHSGMVRDAFSVTALDRFRLVDSLTMVMANRFRLASPASSMATATTSSTVAYRFYEEGLRAFLQNDQSSARRLMRAALTEDSLFAMAAHYEALLAMTNGDVTPDGRPSPVARNLALRLARRAPDRERLMITATVLVNSSDPGASVVAESLAMRFPEDPASHHTLGLVRQSRGDFAGAVVSHERAIALDSAAGVDGGPCRVCDHLNYLTQAYFAFDSLDAAVRTAQRHLRFRPNAYDAVYALAVAATRRGDSVAAYDAYRTIMQNESFDRAWKLNMDLRLELYESFERGLPELLGASTTHDNAYARWYVLISLRNQGRYREADEFQRTGRVVGTRPFVIGGRPDAFNAALLAMARGDGRASARTFEAMPPPDLSWGQGIVSRHNAWLHTLAGMAWASVGDTTRVRVLVDSVQLWGSRSLFGRDPQLHHYLRGMLHVAARRDEDAVREFRAAIVSPSLGFTRINYELGKALLRLGRPREAVAALQPALRGELDSSNMYITRTELHEVLAEAFDRTSQPDSAATHYRAVARAWGRADPPFHARRDHAAQRAAALTSRQVPTS